MNANKENPGWRAGALKGKSDECKHRTFTKINS
jgi:hypothetical protein